MKGTKGVFWTPDGAQWLLENTVRARAATGESQLAIAAAFGISKSLCCAVIRGSVWNEARRQRHRKGNLMRLRLMMAFDSGARREERTTEDILREYPCLEADDIAEALSYAAWRTAEVEVPLTR